MRPELGERPIIYGIYAICAGERVQVAKPRPLALPRPAGRGAFMLDNVLPRVPVGKIGSGFHARVPL
jgi:hypothetical protein